MRENACCAVNFGRAAAGSVSLPTRADIGGSH